MKRYQSTLTKMTRPVCMALAALLMVGAMASCSENENTETALGDNAYLSLKFLYRHRKQYQSRRN